MGKGKIARRTFLIGAAAVAGGVAFGYYYVKKPYANPLEEGLGEGETTFNPYLKIDADDTITVIVPRAEMGQGVQTTLAALVAEELDVPLERLTVEHGPGDWAYYNGTVMEATSPFPHFDESFAAGAVASVADPAGKLIGGQVTGGSSSTRDAFHKMRQAGCAARQMLVTAAAARWNVTVEKLETGGGAIRNPASGQSATYGELAAEAAAMPVPGDLKLKPKSQWKLLGKPQKRTDLVPKVTGTAQFGIDVDLPDMLYATVRMSPRFGAGAKTWSDMEALKVPGVVKVVPVDTVAGSGLGVIAENTWAAFKGAQALDVEWEPAAYPSDSQSLYAALGDVLAAPADYALRDDGDVEIAFADAPQAQVVEADYQAPWLAHACMEPMNATAQWSDGLLTIWAPTQVPTLVQSNCAPLAGVDAGEVQVHTTFLGGGFGRRLEVDYAMYATRLAMETKGRPVKVIWTREEDTTHDMYRPAALCRARARIAKGEGPVAVDMSIASQSLTRAYMDRVMAPLFFAGPDKLITEGAHDQPYAIPDYRVSMHAADLAIPVGSWRSVGNSFNAFFHESFMDEIAIASGVDPLTMRLGLMAEYPAATETLKKAADMAGWGRTMPQGRGLGIAHTLSFGTWVAQVVEVSNDDDAIRIENVWCAADIGEALDPGIIRAQLMSGIVFGLSSAMGQEITFEDGEVQETNFDTFDAMRMNQCPKITVEVLENHHRMGGAGEPGTPPSIPAFGNAIFAATGKRLRSLPFSSQIDFA